MPCREIFLKKIGGVCNLPGGDLRLMVEFPEREMNKKMIHKLKTDMKMKRLVMTALLSLVLWTGATVMAQTGNVNPTSKPTAAVAAATTESDTLGDMNETEAYKVRMAELQLERDRTFYTTEADAEDILDAIVPVLGITVPFLFAFLIIFFFIYYRNKKQKAHYQVIEKAIEAGRELPDGFFESPRSRQARPDKLVTLNQGLVFLGIGLGFAIWSIVLWSINGTEEFGGGVGVFLLGLAAIFILVGAGKLILYRVSSRPENDHTDNQPE